MDVFIQSITSRAVLGLTTLLLSTLAWGYVPSVPAISAGNYTVTWQKSVFPFLQEKVGNGNWVLAQGDSSGPDSVTFTNKPPGTYYYRAGRIVFPPSTLPAYTDIAQTTVIPIPPAPAGLSTPASDSDGSYSVSWNTATGTTSYTLQRRLDSGGWSTIQNSGAASRNETGLGSGKYGYRVRGCGAAGCSAYTAVKSTYVVLAPGVPAAVSVSPATSYSGSHTVSWGASSGSLTGYQLYQQKNGGDFVLKYTGSAANRTLSDQAGGHYIYRVRAYHTIGGYSNYSAYRTAAAATVTAPATPTTFTVPTDNGAGIYNVSWSAAAGAVSYTLQRQTNGGSWSTIQSTGATGRAESGLGNGTYGYRLRACSAVGCSAYSAVKNTHVALAPPMPASISLSPATSYNGSHTVSWGASGGSPSGYQLYQQKDGGGFVLKYTGTATSHTLNNQARGSYIYRVRAYQTTGHYSNYSAYRTAAAATVTAPATPAGLTLPDSNSDGTYTVTWHGVTGATAYLLQRQLHGGSWSTLQNTSATSRPESGISGGVYGYRVRACSAVGCSGYTAVKSITVLQPPSLPAATNPSGDLYSTLADKGALTGTFSVAQDGAAEYSIPIDVPPGISGMAPKLSFHYNSSGGNGPMGMRWRIGGNSHIHRCKATLVRDTSYNTSTAQQTAGTIGRYSSQATLNGLDKMFCLDGQRLIAVNGSYGGNGTEYRTESESFTRIISTGTAGAGPEMFTVYKKNGQILHYGATPAARRVSDLGTGFSWSLSSIADIAANTIEFAYTLVDGEQRLASVHYTKNGTTDLNHRVEFDYGSGPRPDPIIGYTGNQAIKILHRLHAVRVKAAGNLVRKYTVTYENNPHDPLNTSRVASLGLCFDESEIDCAAPADFTWTAYKASPFYPVPDTDDALLSVYKKLADVNGDGLTDVIHYTGDIIVHLSNGDGTFQAPQTWMLKSQLDTIAEGRTYSFADVDADGMADLIFRKDLGVRYHNGNLVTNGFGGYYLATSNGAGFRTPQLYFAPIPGDPYEGQPNLYDLNGDSLPDAYSTLPDTTVKVSLNRGTGFTSRRQWLSSGELDRIGRRFRDINGDGLSDLVKTTSGSTLEGLKVAFNRGNGQSFTGFFTLQNLGTTQPYNVTYLTDVNGDGLNDHVWRYVSDDISWRGIWVSLNTGRGFAPPQRWIDDYYQMDEGELFYHKPGPVLVPPIGGLPAILLPSSYGRVRVVDVNGDGRADIIVPGADGLYVSLSTGIAPGQSGGAQTGFLPKQKWIAYEDYTTIDYFTSLVGDINGDGLIDFLKVDQRIPDSSNNQLYLNQHPRHHIERIRDGYAREITVDYRPLANSGGAYTKGQTTATAMATVSGNREIAEIDGVLPQKISNAHYVVAEYQISNGIDNDTNTHRYHYTSLMHHLSGWGSLGFEAIEQETLVNGFRVNKIISEYSQSHTSNYNLSGKLLKQTLKALDRGLLRTVSQTFNHWKVKTYSDDTDASGHNSPHFFTYLDSSTTYYDDLNGADRYVESRYHLDVADPGPSSCEAPGQTPASDPTGNAAAFDNYGGLKQLKIVRCDSRGNYQSSTKRTYENIDTPSRWILNLVKTEQISNSVPGDSGERDVSFTYNNIGQLTQSAIEPGHATLALVTDYTYNRFGSIERLTESWPGTVNGMNGITSRATRLTESYTADGERTLIAVNPLNHTTTTVFEAVFGQPTSQTDANGVRTRFTYDDLGRPLSETVSTTGEPTLATITRYRRCESAGSCHGENIANARTFVYQKADGQAPVRVFYDLFDREVGNRILGFDGSHIYQYTQYDAQGRIERLSEPHSSGTLYWTVHSRDNLGRVTATRYPDDTRATTDYNGLQITQTNALGQTRIQYNNALGQVVQTVDALNTPVDYTFDAFGNLLSSEVDDNPATRTTITYDELGNKTSLDDPDTGLRQFSVNALGLVYRETDAKNQVTALTFDVLGRMIQRREHGSTSASQWTYDTAANGRGLLAGVTGPDTLGRSFSDSYQYNGYGQTTRASTTIAGTSYTTAFDFDAFSRPTGITYPSGLADFGTLHHYNAMGYLDAIYDAGTGTRFWQVNAADQRGNILAAEFGNARFTTVKTFRASTGRIASITSDNTTGISLQEQTFTFDPLGNLIQRGNPVAATTENFCYDALNRLTHQAINITCAAGSNNHFSYNVLGNITHKAGVGYSYGNGAGPHAVTATAGARAATYHYDANGDMTSGDGRTITWSAFGKPTAISRDSHGISHSVNIAYNPDRRRIERRDTRSGTSTTTTYVQGLFEKVVGGGDTAYRYYVGDIAIVTQSSANGTGTAYQLRDHLGSVIGQVNRQGMIDEDLAYSAWGERLQGAAGSPPVDGRFTPLLGPRGFTDHEHLDGIGLIHMNGRVYDPGLGRFLSADAFVPDPLDSQSFNRYSYVRNRPLSVTDPTGYCDLDSGGCPDGGGAISDRGLGGIMALLRAYNPPIVLAGSSASISEVGQVDGGVLPAVWAGDLTQADGGNGGNNGFLRYLERNMFGGIADNGVNDAVAGAVSGATREIPRILEANMFGGVTDSRYDIVAMVAAGVAIEVAVARFTSRLLYGRVATKEGLREADNIANGPKLANQLRLDSARSPFNSSGRLIESAIQNSTKIIDSSQIRNTAIPKGFSKYTTETFQSPSGNFQTHFYRNDKTGEVFYGQDYKAIFNSNSGSH